MNEGPERISKPKEVTAVFPQKAGEIERMIAVDQNMREKDLEDDTAWDDEVDIRNTESMKRIVGEIGWPTASKVGRDVSESAWLLVQHSDHDPEFQQYCLDLMKAESANEVNQGNIAKLEDRVRVNTKRKQLYGTQFHETRDATGKVINYEPQPMEDPERVNERRAQMGLGSQEEYTAQLTRKYFPHLLDRE